MAKALLSFVALAMCFSSTLAAESEGTLITGAATGDKFISVELVIADRASFVANAEVKIYNNDTEFGVYTIQKVSGDMVTLTTALTKNYDAGAKIVATFPAPAAVPVPVTPATEPGVPAGDVSVTTTMTAWDSSASSSSSENSLQSSNSGSLHGESSSSDSGSNLSNSGSSGSTASGSWGSYLELWQWLFLAICLCCCFCGGAGAATMGGKKKAKKSKAKARPAAAAPAPLVQAPEPVPAVTDQLLMPQQMSVMPSYSMAAPAYDYSHATTYSAGMTFAAPATTSLAGYQYAAPAAAMGPYEQFAPAPAMGSYGYAMPAAQPGYATTTYAQY